MTPQEHLWARIAQAKLVLPVEPLQSSSQEEPVMVSTFAMALQAAIAKQDKLG